MGKGKLLMESGKLKMENEIIIDGVNVAGCEQLHSVNGHYEDKNSFICDEYIDGECNGHNCLYKQFQRLKQENEKLKIENSNFDKQLYVNQEMFKNHNIRMQKFKQVLEEIKNDIMTKSSVCTECIKIAKRINEVLNDK